MRRVILALTIAAVAGRAVSAAPAPGRPVDFADQIQPLLRETCYKCHGPIRQEGKLRLDTRATALAGGEDGKVIIPGNSKDSPLVQRVLGQGDAARMPKKGDPLSEDKIALIRAWIDQGAKWPDAVASDPKVKSHWAYEKPTKPGLPAVKNPKWVRNPIDSFILARLEKEKIAPSPEATKEELIRRLSFDLTGLPPSVADVDAFVADKSATAYDKLVDRLLASPFYGERMAVYWLDLVRYADSIGYHSDNPMNVSPYRDYVIRAFNENKHFDQFAIEQIAGDLLTNSTPEQKIASAYNRLLQTTEEGGAQAKEYEVKYLTDRVRNASTAWLGVTLGCAQCHNHKFDPFTQKDFYSMGAFFADVQEAAVGRREDGMSLPSAEQTAKLKAFDDQIATLKNTLVSSTPQLAAAQVEWEKQQAVPVEWKVLEPQTLTAAAGTKLAKQADGTVLASGTIPAKETYTVTAKTELKGITGIRLEVFPDPSFGAQGPGASGNGNFVLTEFTVTAGAPPAPVKFSRAAADHSQDTFPVANAIDGKNDTGWAILPQTGKPHTAIFEAASPFGGDGGATLTFTLDHQSQYGAHNIGKFRLSVTAGASPANLQGLPPNILAVLATPPDKRNDQQKGELAAHYRTIAPLLQPARDQLAGAEKQKTDLLAALPKCLVTTSGAPRAVRMLKRGNWQDESGEIVLPAVPAFLPQPNIKGDKATRLDLANWIVSRDNPLTARVLVNRLWKLYFGAGLAAPLDDLGTQGATPTHPELLNWMAVEFMDSGWDVKHMVRLLVTSNTYQQSSRLRPDLKERDPLNRLYARQSRYRLDAEFVRDNALAVSGLLVTKVGGKSVFPYQPPGYWYALNFPAREWQNDKGEGLYRRGLYTHWQRTFLHPSLVAFDACSREEASAERPRSNIPQQALTLLNDPMYVEAARVLAEHMIKEGGADDTSRITWAYRRALARAPRPAEIKALQELHQKQLTDFSAHKEDALKFVSTGDWPVPKDIDAAELAAWAEVARTILNLHETITRS